MNLFRTYDVSHINDVTKSAVHITPTLTTAIHNWPNE